MSIYQEECPKASACTPARTVRKWIARFISEGDAGLQNRRSAPYLVANKLPVPWLTMTTRLRREYRMTGAEIAERLPAATQHRRRPRRPPRPGAAVAPGAERAGAALQPARAGELVHVEC